MITEQKQIGPVLYKYEYQEDGTVKVYEYCGCTNPWKFKRSSTWTEVNGVKVIK